MGKEETLLRIKGAEAQIQALQEAAEKDRERTLREARREALELADRLRAEAEARYRTILDSVEGGVKADREKILAAGREEASHMMARGEANVDRAVDLVLEKFRGALRA